MPQKRLIQRLPLLLTSILLLLTACSIEKQARDIDAALKGVIESAQSQYKDSCVANPAQSTCKLINRGVDAQNALTTAAQSYCGWSATVAPSDPHAACKPIKGSDPSAIKAALSNAAQLTKEIKGVIK